LPKIVHINCPRCGGTLGMAGAERVVKCRYCGSWSLVEAPGVVPEYWVEPRLTEVGARRVIQRLLTEDDMPEGLLKNSTFHSARLYFIPYHELTARRLGTMTTTQQKSCSRGTSAYYSTLGRSVYGMDADATGNLWQECVRSRKMEEVDTRVIMSDVSRLDPALRLSDWRLEEAEISALRSGPEGALKPVDRRKMERLGKVYDPTVKTDQLIAMSGPSRMAASLDDNTELAEVRIKRIYYPVWRIRYKHRGRFYGATVDGVSGKVMAARAPQDDGSRVLWMLGASAVVSLFAGKILRVAGRAIMASSGGAGIGGLDMNHLVGISIEAGYILIPLFLIILMAVFFILGIGWEQFRYAGEINIAGDKRWIEKVNRPAVTFFDKAGDAVQSVLKSFFNAARSRRGRF